MESHTSQEKLMRLEAGLIHPQTPSFRKPRGSHGCTKRILIYLATVLLVVVGYEIWQSVHTDYVLKKIEDGQRTSPLEPESTKLQEMAEELKRVQLALKELKEQVDQRPQVTPETTELPKPTTITESIADENTEDWDRKWLASVLEGSSNDDAKPSNSDSGISNNTEAPEVIVIDEELIQDPVFEPVTSLSEIDETESGWRLRFYFIFGQGAEEKKVDVIETEVGVPTEAEDVTSDEQPKGYIDKLLLFGLGSGDEEKATTTDPEFFETLVVDYDDLYDDDYYGSYEYDFSSKPGDYGTIETKNDEDSTTTSPKIALGDTTTETVPVSTSGRNEPFLKKDDIVPRSQQPGSIDESVPASLSTETISDKNRQSLSQMIEGHDESDSYSLDKIRDKLDVVPSSASSDAKAWISYISKRSIETASNEGPREFISSEELGRKLAVIQQAVDDENHILQNELTVASEPAKSILRQKLNDFYRKMEAVSAHIDRLHQRYLKVNKLDDDYVSREFPSDEENH